MNGKILNRKKKPKNLLSIIFGTIIFIGLSTALFIFLFFNAALNYFTKDLPDVTILFNWSPPETTKIFSRGGKLLYEPHGSEVRTKISLEKIPKNLQNAFIAAEDKRFWEHQGMDFLRIASVILHDAKNPDDLQGASTITQQLVRNCLLDNKKTAKRKIQEIILAYLLEKNISKEKILELYLNQIPFGSNLYGIESASQRFWGKKSSDLNLAESAVLAAIPKAASYFSPYENPKALLERQKLVLNLMKEQSLISPEEALIAKEETINFKKPESPIIYPHFAMYVMDELEKKFGKEAVIEGGLQVMTSIDDKLQKIAENAIKENLQTLKKLGASNAALAAVDAKTGQILAMAGSVDFWSGSSGQYNATTAYRQPGSTFKPLVYISAFEKGNLTPESIISDSFVNFNGYKPNNFDFTYHGDEKVRYALANSHNIPAVKTLNMIGLDYFSQKMSELDIIIKPSTGLPAALGAEAVPPLKMAAAYASFANSGKFNPASPFVKITNKNGGILEEYSPKNTPVFSEESAAMINSILSDYGARTATFGNLRHRLELSDRPVAAKTGTTDNRRDAWTIGYTPSIVCAVWVGNNDNSPMGRKAEGVTAAAPIWKSFMIKAAEGTDTEEFDLCNL